MVKLLQKSLREYRGVSILTPILVSLEVVMECIIPFITARLVNEIKAGCSIDEILRIGGLLVLMAALGALFGVYPAVKAAKMRPVEALRRD